MRVTEIRFNKIIMNLSLVALFTASACNQSKPLSYQLESVKISSSKVSGDNLVFTISAVNTNDTDISLKFDNFEQSLINSNIYLLSNRLNNGSIKLRPANSAIELSIKGHNKSNLLFLLNETALSRSLGPQSKQAINKNDIKTFLHLKNYTLIVIDFKNTSAAIVPIARTFKLSELNATE